MNDYYNIDSKKYYINNTSNIDCSKGIIYCTPLIGIIFIMFISFCTSCYPFIRVNNTTDLDNRERLLINNLPIINIDSNNIDETCSICLEKFVLNDKVNKLNCNHIYHKLCLDDWINNNNCPLCRSIIV